VCRPVLGMKLGVTGSTGAVDGPRYPPSQRVAAIMCARPQLRSAPRAGTLRYLRLRGFRRKRVHGNPRYRGKVPRRQRCHGIGPQRPDSVPAIPFPHRSADLVVDNGLRFGHYERFDAVALPAVRSAL
jgi:hypothetical protein